MKANSITEAWNIADSLIEGDYMKDESISQRTGYPVYVSTANNGEYICDLNVRLEVNKADGTSINIWIEEDEKPDTEILGVQAKQTGENTYLVRLVNGKTFTVITDAEHHDKDSYGNDRVTTWEFKVDTQYFSNFDYAYKYIHELITEKLTGNRIIYHARKEVPCICGGEEFLKEHENDSWGCHAQKDNTFSNNCSYCPIAEEIQAKRDGVTLIYML